MSKFDIKNYVNPHITTLEDFNSQYKESIQNPSSFFLKKAISYLHGFRSQLLDIMEVLKNQNGLKMEY